MTLDPDALVAGPRGRGLLMHLFDDVAIRTLTMRADFAAAQGSSAMLYMHPVFTPGVRGLVDRVRTRRERARLQHERRQPVTPAELAEAISATPLPSLGNAALVEALSRSVDDAKAWQPPDGNESVVASEAVREALKPLADVVASSPFAIEWTAPASPHQWALDRKDDRLGAGPVPEPADALATWRTAIEEEERGYVERRARGEQGGGPWWSTPPGYLTRSTSAWGGFGPVGLYLEEDSRGPSLTSATPVGRPPARTYEITDASAWARLCKDYPLDVTASREYLWHASIGPSDQWTIPDWQAMALDWDAVHLTIAGYLSAATTLITVAEGAASTIAGWGPDETVWLHENPAPTSAAIEWRRFDQLGWRIVSHSEEES